MRTEIITIENEHFEYRTDEKGEVYKHKLSDVTIKKQVLVTYDDEGNEINREAYVPPAPIDISNINIDTLPDEQLIKLMNRINLLKNG